MITFRAGTIALLTLLAMGMAGCDREQQDWRSAEAADTSEAYGRFLEQHAESELANAARTRIEQLQEQRAWKHTQGVGTMEAFRKFLAVYPNGRWAEEARIHIESFAFGSAPRTAPAGDTDLPPGASGVNALRMAMGATAPPVAHGSQSDAALAALAQPPPTAGIPAAALAHAADTQRGVTHLAEADEDTASAAPAAQERTVNSASGAAGYGVQLGAFGSAASADREWQRLQGRFGAQLGTLAPRIVQANTDAGDLYRLQAQAPDEAKARAICDSLREQSQACVPVVPR
jgi:hypothetical protein